MSYNEIRNQVASLVSLFNGFMSWKGGKMRRWKSKKTCSLILGFALLSSILPVKAQEGACLNLWLSDSEVALCEDGIEEFQELYPEVELEITTYLGDDRNEEIQRMHTRLMAGEGPDLLLFTSFGGEDVYKLMKAQVFAPLDEWMEKDDNWNREEYVENVLDAGVFGGTQYVMPLRYQLPTILTTKGRLEELGKTKEELNSTLSILEEMAAIKESGKRVFASGGFVYILYLGDPLVDYEAEGIGIDRELLERAATAYSKVFDEANTIMDVDSFLSGYGRELAAGNAFFYLPPSIDETIGNAMGAAASDIPVLLPLYTEDGLTTAEVNFYGGIRANSENKENAWNLLRCLMGEASQTKMIEESGNLPVSKAALEATFAEKEEQMAIYTEGSETGELPEGFMEEFQSLAEHPGRSLFISSVCMSDFYNTMTPFYQGQKSFDDCYTEFENFVKIYTSE